MKTVGSKTTVRPEIKVIVFTVDHIRLGVMVEQSQLQEILHHPEVTDRTESQDGIVGMVGLRGDYFPVLSLRHLLGMSGPAITDTARVLIVNESGHKFGFLVDGVERIYTIPLDAVCAPDSVLADQAAYLDGVTRVSEEEDELILLINLQRLIPAEIRQTLA